MTYDNKHRIVHVTGSSFYAWLGYSKAAMSAWTIFGYSIYLSINSLINLTLFSNIVLIQALLIALIGSKSWMQKNSSTKVNTNFRFNKRKVYKEYKKYGFDIRNKESLPKVIAYKKKQDLIKAFQSFRALTETNEQIKNYYSEFKWDFLRCMDLIGSADNYFKNLDDLSCQDKNYELTTYYTFAIDQIEELNTRIKKTLAELNIQPDFNLKNA